MNQDEKHLRLGAAIAGITAEHSKRFHSAFLPIHEAFRRKARKDQLEIWEQELRPLINHIVGMIGGMDALPAEVAKVFKGGADPEHQVELLAGAGILVSFIFGMVKELGEPFIATVLQDLWGEFPNKALSAQDAAVADIRGLWDGAAAGLDIGKNGINSERAGVMLRLAQQPLPLGEVVTAYRRGLIGAGDFGAAIKDLSLSENWVPIIDQLKLAPPSYPEAIMAYVQSHIDEGTARKWAEASGLMPDAFDAMYQTAGRPPGIEEMLSLLNRGIVDQGVVEQAVRESDIKDKYIADIIAMRKYLIPPREVSAMLSHGAIDAATAARMFQDHGMTTEDAAAMVRYSHSTKTVAIKQLSQSTIIAGYRDLMISRADAKARLEHLSFTPEDADFLLDVVDQEREMQIKMKAVNMVGGHLVTRRISKDDAGRQLDTLGIDAARKEFLLSMWQVEMDASPRTLTEAQIVKAVKNGALTYQQGIDRHVGLGYSLDDATLLMLTDLGPPS